MEQIIHNNHIKKSKIRNAFKNIYLSNMDEDCKTTDTSIQGRVTKLKHIKIRNTLKSIKRM